MKPYGKSLLYLVSGAFEREQPADLLGLQKSLKRDVKLIRFFGLAGREQVADVLFSETGPGAPLRSRTTSITHGGFDNDVPTMTSIARRILDVPDTTPMVDYFEDPVEGREPKASSSGVPVRAVAARAPAAAARTAAVSRRRDESRKKWTVLVWMAGDNDLEEFGESDLGELKRVGSTSDVDILVQFDSMKDDRTRRYHVQRGTTLDEDVVEELGETNTGDPAVAIDFFTWGIERHPADRVLAVIWNHGSGIDETDVYNRARARGVSVVRGAQPDAETVPRHLVRTALATRHRRALFATTVDQAVQDRAIAYDDTSQDFLDNLELKRVLTDVARATGRPIDVLGFDACLMNMIEIAYQLRTTAGVMVGSEELEPGDGWPYDRVLKTLAAAPDMTPLALGTEIVKQYIASYRSGNVTQSALDLPRVDATASAVDALAKALVAAIRTPAEYVAVTRSINATQRFDMKDFVDLGHFCSELATRTKVAAVKAALKDTLTSLRGAGGLVAAEQHKGSGVRGATGVAVYFPRGPVNKVYARLDFAKKTAWSQFLKAYHEA
jgi:hypothetical protein